MSRKSCYLGLLALLLVASLALTLTVSAHTAVAPAPVTVEILSRQPGGANPYEYSPASLKIKVGTAVRWHNSDSNRPGRTATSDRGSAFGFDTGDIAAKGTSTPIVFTKVGTFHYHDKAVQPPMHAIVTVTP
jgi:plastocyanin